MERSGPAPTLPNSSALLHISPGSSSSSSPVQTANVVTPQQRDLPGRLSSVVLNNNERNNVEENRHAGLNTDLSLYTDRLMIKKKLTASDLLQHFSRLSLPQHCVETHVLPHLDEAMVRLVNSTTGLPVIVRNVDEREDHELVLGRWEPFYVLKGGWMRHFVKGRGLKAGDEIGMFWDPDDRKFYFTVHRRVAQGPNNAAG